MRGIQRRGRLLWVRVCELLQVKGHWVSWRRSHHMLRRTLCSDYSWVFLRRILRVVSCRSCSLFSHAEQMLSSAVESQPSPPSLFPSVWTRSCEKGWGCQHLKYPQSHDPDKANRNPAGIIHLNKILRLAISYSISNDASAKYA